VRSRPGRILSSVLAALALAAVARAQAKSAAPVAGKTARFAVSQNVRDLPSAARDPNSTLPAEWIRDNDRLPRSKGPFHVSTGDGGLQSSATGITMPGPTATFAGISADGADTVGGRYAPPDTVGDVGPNHYVQAVNTVVRVFDKNGAPLSNLVSLSTFFGPLGSGCNGEFGDPIVLYDPLADRWLISQFGLPNGFQPPFHQCIGISQTPDPTGAFYLYDFLMPNKVNDYPHFGVWPDGYYMSDNQFAIGGGSFAGAGLLAFDRVKMLVGDPTASYIYFDYFPIDPSSGGMLPSDLDGLTPPPPGTPNLFMEFRADEFGDPFDALRIYEFHADFATPANSTLTARPDLAVAAFDARLPNSRAVVEQPPPAGSGDSVDAIADRMMFRVAYRTLAGGAQSFVANWTVNVSGVNPTGASTYQAGVRFTELRRNPATGDMTIQNQVTYAPGSGNGATGRNLWMGSAAQDYQGNSAVGFSASSTTLFPSLIWAGRLAADPPNSLAQGEATAVAGIAVQRGSANRWGDYSAMSVDPSDDCTFFYTQEYYVNSNPSGFDWVTSVAKFEYPGCVAAPRGTVAGVVTICGNGSPIAGAVVSDGLGHVRVTDAAGAYTMDLPPGPYTLTITKGNFGAGGGGVVVNDGATTAFNACLVGVPLPAVSGASLTAESCLPGNGALDPGETVTVSFCLQNTGGADTTDLVVTLSATGGVVDPPAPVDFGVVAVGGPSVCRDVTFGVDPLLVCGATVTASLGLADGASNLGTVVTVFQTGIPKPVSAEGFDGVVAPALPSGWTATNAMGASPLWTTTTSGPDTAPNAAFVNDSAAVTDKRLASASLPIATSSARLSFRNSYNLENGFDGGVLEVSIDGGPFADILAAGGSFVSGGYNGTLDSSSGNPLGGRSAWTGNSGGYLTSAVNLPASFAGTSVVFRWRLGTDNGIGGTGWRVDTVSLSDGYTCCSAPTGAALEVDRVASPGDGDGVWEPGETASVEPSWCNNTTLSAVTLDGTASNLSGPAGASYTIMDGTADYGTLAAGATGSCAGAGDCYVMSIDNPATRPAAHWDATFDELLSTGQSRPWTLHVGESFADVPRVHSFYAFIENIFHNGITSGCAAGTYCPGNDVTRGQMAVFILKAEHGASYVPPACSGIFADVLCPSQFADWIEQLSAEGITGGCGGGNYCPSNSVTRAQMAVFLLKGEHGSAYVPPVCAGIFTDVPCPSGFAVDWIERLFNEGVTGGCGVGIYCPSNPNTRGQMAVFLVKTFGLLLYGP
jgi:hypothetical protein